MASGLVLYLILSITLNLDMRLRHDDAISFSTYRLVSLPIPSYFLVVREYTKRPLIVFRTVV